MNLVPTDRSLRELLPWVAAALVLVLLPVLTNFNLATEVVVFAVFAIGFNLIAGYGGQLSFGHAAYFGLGAYGTILCVNYVTPDLYVSMFVGVLVAGVVSLIIGWLSLYRRGVYFAMITLAFGQMVYFGVNSFSDLTGGSNGLYFTDIRATLGGVTPLGASPDLYVVSLVVLGLLVLLNVHLLNTPFGKVLVAIQSNEQRTKHLGYNSTIYLEVAFVLSGLVSGLAGALFAALVRFVTPDILFWSMSGEVVLITIIGGIGTVLGTIIGALAFVLMSDWLSSVTSHWPIVLGGLFVLVVLFAPEGIYGIYKNRQ
jgi:branched-chain amino acid transport system permease protein